MKYLRLITVLVLANCAFFVNAQSTTPMMSAAQGEIRVTEVEQKLSEGALMIDVREQHEVNLLAFDVENILHIPMSQLDNRLDEIPNDRVLIIACKSGGRSRRVTTALKQNGYSEVLNMTGGINAWQQRGFSVIKDELETGSAEPSKQEKVTLKACCVENAKTGTACCEKTKTDIDKG